MTQNAIGTHTAQPINGGKNYVAQADNGNLWCAMSEFGNHTIRLFYSANKGLTWTEEASASVGMSWVTNPCIYIIGNKIWMIASTTEASTSDIRIWWGSLDASRTDITWAGNQGGLWGPTSDYTYVGGMLVHAEGTGYKMHAVSTNRYWDDCRYWRFSLDSSGAWTGTDTASQWDSTGIEGTSVSSVLLDPATKDIFVLHLQGGSSPSLTFQKRAYTSATWPAGTVRTLYSLGYYASDFSAAFDGDRVVVALEDKTVNANTPIVLERDKADTTTTTRTPPSGVTSSSATVMAIQTNASKDILLTFTDNGTDQTDIYKNTYNRGTATWSGATLVRDTTPNTAVRALEFIPGTKYLFFFGDTASWASYMLDDLLEVAATGSATLQGVATFTAVPTFTVAGGTSIPRPFVEIAFSTDPTSSVPVWTDVTQYVSRMNVRRGRQRELDVIEPGSATLTLDNDDRRFDPLNTSSPYYPNVLPVRRIRIRAIYNNQIYSVFSGYIGGWPQEYPGKHRNVVEIEAIDALGFLSFADLSIVRPQELSGARVEAVLNLANWPAGDRNLDTGQETLAAITEVESDDALTELQEIATTEMGRVFASKDGKITFHGRDRIVGSSQPASLGTWADGDLANLLTANQYSLETDTAGWNAETNCSIARTTTQFLDGAASLQLTATGAGTMGARTDAGLSARPVVAGTSYTGTAWFKATTTRRTCRVYVNWYDSTGAFISNVNGSVSEAVQGWARASVTSAAPGNAAYASIAAYVESAGASEVHYVDLISLSEPVNGYLYDDIVPVQDEGEIYNRVTITRRGGTPQVAEDAASQSAYFLRDYAQSDLDILSDGDALARAQFLLSQRKDPRTRFSSLGLDPRVDDQWAASLVLELGDHILVKRFVATPPMISQNVFVDGISHDVNRDKKSWTMSLSLTPLVDVAGFWIAGVGILNTSTRLAF